MEKIAHPPIVSKEEWRAARVRLLEQEKAVTRHYDEVAAAVRRLPMVRVEKQYLFDGAEGTVSLLSLFHGKRQLIVYHFMFDPEWEKGCMGCTSFINALGDLSMLAESDTVFVAVARAPFEKLERYRREKGWEQPFFSSFKTDFNYDYHVTLDDSVVPAEYNFRTRAETEAKRGKPVEMRGEAHGLSVFFRIDNEVFHSYSTYARGCESLCDSYRLLDKTPYGRQQDFEDSPEGWPQRPTYG